MINIVGKKICKKNFCLKVKYKKKFWYGKNFVRNFYFLADQNNSKSPLKINFPSTTRKIWYQVIKQMFCGQIFENFRLPQTYRMA